MKKAIVLAAYGTSDLGQMSLTIEPVYRSIKAAFPQCLVCLAYTSRKIIGKLSAKGHSMVTEIQAIEKCIQAGCTEIFLQPLFITYGSEFELLQDRVEQVKEDNPHVTILFGEPLLGKSFRGNQGLLQAIVRWLPRRDSFSQSGDGILLVAHGGSSEAAQAYKTLEVWLKEVYPHPVQVVTLLDEDGHKILDKVSICHAWAQEHQVDHIHLYPLFFSLGFHPQRDIFGTSEDSYISLLRKSGYEVTRHERGLGQVSELIDYLVGQIKR